MMVLNAATIAGGCWPSFQNIQTEREREREREREVKFQFEELNESLNLEVKGQTRVESDM